MNEQSDQEAQIEEIEQQAPVPVLPVTQTLVVPQLLSSQEAQEYFQSFKMNLLQRQYLKAGNIIELQGNYVSDVSVDFAVSLNVAIKNKQARAQQLFQKKLVQQHVYIQNVRQKVFGYCKDIQTFSFDGMQGISSFSFTTSYTQRQLRGYGLLKFNNFTMIRPRNSQLVFSSNDNVNWFLDPNRSTGQKIASVPVLTKQIYQKVALDLGKTQFQGLGFIHFNVQIDQFNYVETFMLRSLLSFSAVLSKLVIQVFSQNRGSSFIQNIAGMQKILHLFSKMFQAQTTADALGFFDQIAKGFMGYKEQYFLFTDGAYLDLIIQTSINAKIVSSFPAAILGDLNKAHVTYIAQKYAETFGKVSSGIALVTTTIKGVIASEKKNDASELAYYIKNARHILAANINKVSSLEQQYRILKVDLHSTKSKNQKKINQQHAYMLKYVVLVQFQFLAYLCLHRNFVDITQKLSLGFGKGKKKKHSFFMSKQQLVKQVKQLQILTKPFAIQLYRQSFISGIPPSSNPLVTPSNIFKINLQSSVAGQMFTQIRQYMTNESRACQNRISLYQDRVVSLNPKPVQMPTEQYNAKIVALLRQQPQYTEQQTKYSRFQTIINNFYHFETKIAVSNGNPQEITAMIVDQMRKYGTTFANGINSHFRVVQQQFKKSNSYMKSMKGALDRHTLATVQTLAENTTSVDGVSSKVQQLIRSFTDLSQALTSQKPHDLILKLQKDFKQSLKAQIAATKIENKINKAQLSQALADVFGDKVYASNLIVPLTAGFKLQLAQFVKDMSAKANQSVEDLQQKSNNAIQQLKMQGIQLVSSVQNKLAQYASTIQSQSDAYGTRQDAYNQVVGQLSSNIKELQDSNQVTMNTILQLADANNQRFNQLMTQQKFQTAMKQIDTKINQTLLNHIQPGMTAEDLKQFQQNLVTQQTKLFQSYLKNLVPEDVPAAIEKVMQKVTGTSSQQLKNIFKKQNKKNIKNNEFLNNVAVRLQSLADGSQLKEAVLQKLVTSNQQAISKFGQVLQKVQQNDQQTLQQVKAFFGNTKNFQQAFQQTVSSHVNLLKSNEQKYQQMFQKSASQNHMLSTNAQKYLAEMQNYYYQTFKNVGGDWNQLKNDIMNQSGYIANSLAQNHSQYMRQVGLMKQMQLAALSQNQQLMFSSQRNGAKLNQLSANLNSGLNSMMAQSADQTNRIIYNQSSMLNQNTQQNLQILQTQNQGFNQSSQQNQKIYSDVIGGVNFISNANAQNTKAIQESISQLKNGFDSNQIISKLQQTLQAQTNQTQQVNSLRQALQRTKQSTQNLNNKVRQKQNLIYDRQRQIRGLKDQLHNLRVIGKRTTQSNQEFMQIKDDLMRLTNILRDNPNWRAHGNSVQDIIQQVSRMTRSYVQQDRNLRERITQNQRLQKQVTDSKALLTQFQTVGNSRKYQSQRQYQQMKRTYQTIKQKYQANSKEVAVFKVQAESREKQIAILKNKIQNVQQNLEQSKRQVADQKRQREQAQQNRTTFAVRQSQYQQKLRQLQKTSITTSEQMRKQAIRQYQKLKQISFETRQSDKRVYQIQKKKLQEQIKSLQKTGNKEVKILQDQVYDYRNRHMVSQSQLRALKKQMQQKGTEIAELKFKIKQNGVTLANSQLLVSDLKAQKRIMQEKLSVQQARFLSKLQLAQSKHRQEIQAQQKKYRQVLDRDTQLIINNQDVLLQTGTKQFKKTQEYTDSYSKMQDQQTQKFTQTLQKRLQRQNQIKQRQVAELQTWYKQKVQKMKKQHVTEIAQLQQKIDRCKDQIKVQQTKTDQIKQQIIKTTEQKQRLKASQEKSQLQASMLTQRQKDRSVLQQKLRIAKQQHQQQIGDQKKKLLQKLQQNKLLYQAQSAEYKNQIARIKDQSQKLVQQNSDFVRASSTLHQQLHRRQDEISRLQQNATFLNDRIRQQTQTQQHLQASKQNYQKQFQQLSRARMQAQQKYSSLNDQLTNSMHQLAVLRQNQQMRQEIINNLKTQYEVVKQQLRRNEQDLDAFYDSQFKTFQMQKQLERQALQIQRLTEQHRKNTKASELQIKVLQKQYSYLTRLSKNSIRFHQDLITSMGGAQKKLTDQLDSMLALLATDLSEIQRINVDKRVSQLFAQLTIVQSNLLEQIARYRRVQIANGLTDQKPGNNDQTLEQTFRQQQSYTKDNQISMYNKLKTSKPQLIKAQPNLSNLLSESQLAQGNQEQSQGQNQQQYQQASWLDKSLIFDQPFSTKPVKNLFGPSNTSFVNNVSFENLFQAKQKQAIQTPPPTEPKSVFKAYTSIGGSFPHHNLQQHQSYCQSFNEQRQFIQCIYKRHMQMISQAQTSIRNFVALIQNQYYDKIRQTFPDKTQSQILMHVAGLMTEFVLAIQKFIKSMNSPYRQCAHGHFKRDMANLGQGVFSNKKFADDLFK